MGIDDLLDKLEKAENDFAGSDFLVPILGAHQVQVRIAGIVCQLAISGDLPPDYYGWAILRALSTSQARYLRPASLSERGAYIRLFPTVQLIPVLKRKYHWLAMPAQRGDNRFKIDGLVSLWFPEEGTNRFDTVRAGFDGRFFWYRDRDPVRDPSIGAYLREQILQEDEDGLPSVPETLRKRGLSAEERAAYAFTREVIAEAKIDRVEVRLREALDHAGAVLRDFSERDDNYIVRYEVDGISHTSTIRQEDLTVMTAGICLSGQDRFFDLASLVGVLREAGHHHIYWVGDDHLPEDRYWQIHPPEEP